MEFDPGLRFLSPDQIDDLDAVGCERYLDEIAEVASKLKDVGTAVEALAVCRLINRLIDRKIEELNGISMKKGMREKKKRELLVLKRKMFDTMKPLLAMVQFKVN
ncbi:MAG TPA: hypothetical protein VFG51_00835 [Candidatus Saccharimonadia bacterium]|nr:hypothetical protein [Candidatus Saccharimonadia bacterium]